VAALLARLAELETRESAHVQAAAIWGASIPAPVLAALAGMDADAAPDDQPTDGQDGSQDRPAPAMDSPPGEPVAAGGNESESPLTVTSQIQTYSGFPRSLFQLTPHRQPLLELSLTLPPALEGDRTAFERQFLESYVAFACSELSPSEVRQLLKEAAQFTNGLQWTRAKTALVRQLVDLGLSDTAVEEVQATWPEKPPAQVIATISHLVEPAMRRRLVTGALTAVWEMKDPVARADALGALIGEMDGADHERALQNIEDAIQDLIAADPSLDTASEVAELLGALPADRRLPLWQEALHAAARGTRRQLLTQLLNLIPVVERLGPRQLYEDVAETLLDIRHRWP
jgi:hypothetical protein